jgi:hypothetical protein
MKNNMFAVYEKFLKVSGVKNDDKTAQRIAERFNVMIAKNPSTDFTVETLVQIASDLNLLTEQKLANQRIATKFVGSLTSDQLTATLAAHPEVEQALNGQYGGEIDWTKVRVVTPERAERFTTTDIETSRDSARRSQASKDRANTAAREVNRSVANAVRGTRFNQSKEG